MMSGYVFNYFIVSQVFGRPRNLQHWALAHDTPHLQWIIQSSQMDGISVHIEGTRRRSTGVGFMSDWCERKREASHLFIRPSIYTALLYVWGSSLPIVPIASVRAEAAKLDTLPANFIGRSWLFHQSHCLTSPMITFRPLKPSTHTQKREQK